jgi:hypothetical protein
MRASVLIVAAFLSSPAFAEEKVLEATTSGGEKVRLLPNGRWEYADQKKADVQREAVQSELARERTSQGGMFGIGRRVYEGDKDYNRGSLNPARR